MDEITTYYSLVASQSDIILGSREEMDITEAFSGLDGTDADSASYWLSKDCKYLIIKHGKEGSYAYLKGEESYKINPFPAKLMKGFGGGDAYASAFLYCLINGYPVQEALSMATASASMLIASHACSADMPSLEELTEYRKKGTKEHGEMVTKL